MTDGEGEGFKSQKRPQWSIWWLGLDLSCYGLHQSKPDNRQLIMVEFWSYQSADSRLDFYVSLEKGWFIYRSAGQRTSMYRLFYTILGGMPNLSTNMVNGLLFILIGALRSKKIYFTRIGMKRVIRISPSMDRYMDCPISYGTVQLNIKTKKNT